jgi:hypothetical protein
VTRPNTAAARRRAPLLGLIVSLAVLGGVPGVHALDAAADSRPLGVRPGVSDPVRDPVGAPTGHPDPSGASAVPDSVGSPVARAVSRPGAAPVVARRSAAPQPGPSRRAPAPVELVLDRLGIRVKVVPVGVAADGTMALPEDVRRVGWYRFGAPPSAPRGSVVVAGHVDSLRQGRGPLAALAGSRTGDVAFLRLADGGRRRYRVVAREQIPRSRLPVDELFAPTGPARLTLITCAGRFRPGSGYADNLVVTAVPVA